MFSSIRRISVVKVQKYSVKQLRKNIAGFIDDAHDLSVQVDGHYVKKLDRRIQSPVFWIPLPAENLYGGGADCPPEYYSPSVTDGY